MNTATYQTDLRTNYCVGVRLNEVNDVDEEKMDVAKILTDSVNGTGSEKYAP